MDYNSRRKTRMKRLLITLCTYNERDNIALLIPELLDVATHAMQNAESASPDQDIAISPPDDDSDTTSARESNPPAVTVLVIDDGSPDRTGDWVLEQAQSDVRIQLLQRGSKQGLGTATLAGFRYGIEHKFDWLLNLDADFSHNPKYVPELIHAMRECDVAIGSRYVAGGSVGDWSLGRRLMSRAINLAARILLGLRTSDNSGSFRCYSVPQLARIDWSQTVARGYAFQEEILYRCRRIGCRFHECPIVFEERRYGETKISWQECLSAAAVLLRLGWQNATRRPVTLEDRRS
jgi:dolichol-phosphate mannosyltransferase